MGGIPHWDEEYEEWDKITLYVPVELPGVTGRYTSKEVVLPGVWAVESGDVKRVFDVKKSPGRDGAIVKDEGYENGQFRLLGQFISYEAWDAWQAALLDIHPRKKGNFPPPTEISHPAFRLLGISHVRITGIGVPRIDRGIMTVEITVIEHIEKPVQEKKSKKKAAATLQGQQAEALGFRPLSNDEPNMAEEYGPEPTEIPTDSSTYTYGAGT